MVIVYLCGIVAVVAAVIWAAWQRGAVGSLGRAVLALLTAAVTLVVVVAGAYLAALALGLARAYDFGGVVLVTGATMGLLVFGPIAFAAWIVTLFGFRHARGRAKADVQGFPGRAARGWVGVWPVVGVVSVAVLVAIAVSYHAERNKPADDHDIVALRFVDGSRTIYALNDANVLKIWRLAQPLPLEARKPDGPSPYALQASIPLPLTYVPNDMRVSRDGRHVALRDNTGIIVYGIDAAGRQARIVAKFPGAIAATEHEGGFVIADQHTLRWIVPGEAQAETAVPWPGSIVAIEAGAAGLAVAELGGAVFLIGDPQQPPHALGSSGFQARALAFSGDARALVSLHGADAGVVFDLDTNVSRRTQQEVRVSSAWPLRRSLVLACYGRAASCQTLDTRDGSLRRVFMGIVPSFRCADAVPDAAALAFKGQLVVITLAEDGTPRGHAFLKDRAS